MSDQNKYIELLYELNYIRNDFSLLNDIIKKANNNLSENVVSGEKIDKGMLDSFKKRVDSCNEKVNRICSICDSMRKARESNG